VYLDHFFKKKKIYTGVFRVYKNKVGRKIFVLKWQDVTEGWKSLHAERLNYLHHSPNILIIVGLLKEEKIRFANH
jgi:hypothetical protein